MRKTDYVIIGTGFGGLCMAAKLLAQGKTDFVVLEKAMQVGGTWRENTYPGAECDIPSSLYSFSFWQNPTWDYKWSDQAQILDYLIRFTDEHGIRKHIEFGRQVISANYQESEGRWLLECADGTQLNCRFLITAIGQLHHPRMPVIKGMELFEGTNFHSAQWPERLDLSGKRVGVIGNAASAVQFIPEIAKQADAITIYQRSPNWLLPKPNRPYSNFEKKIAKRLPWLANIYRFSLWWAGEFFVLGMIRGKPIRSWLGKWACTKNVKTVVKDSSLHDSLIPDYPIGAKRILFATDYLKSLNRNNVELVTGDIQAVTTTGIEVSANNQSTHREHDVLVYGTGFHTNPFLKHINVTGRNGKTIREHWQDGAFAYLGVQTADFPNMFMLYGPNTNTGHTSIVFKLEAQVAMVLRLLKELDDQGKQAIEVDETVEQNFNADIQQRLSELAWDKIEASWYKDGNRVTNNWPGSSLEYRRKTTNPNIQHFKFT